MPHRVVFEPIKLAQSIHDKKHLEGLLSGFLNENEDLLKVRVEDLRVQAFHKSKKVWHIQYLQEVGGLDVWNSEIVFKVHENGNLFAMGFDFYEFSNQISNISINQSQIESSLNSKYSDQIGTGLNFEFEPSEFLFAVLEQGSWELRRIQEVKATRQPDIFEINLVDVQSGEILETIDKVHSMDTGHVSGSILPILATDTLKNQAFTNLDVSIDGSSITTNEKGEFVFQAGVAGSSLQAELKGPYVDIDHFNQSDAQWNQTVFPGDSVRVIWDDNNSDLSERNVFYHINLMHSINKDLDPNFNGLDYPLVCFVNDNAATCNAYWNTVNLHFNVQAPGCSMNSAHGASVVYHEYGHSTNDRLYQQLGVSQGMSNPTLHEAFADIYSCLILDESRFALGWFGPGTFTRNLSNSNTFPVNIVGQQHTDGTILGGAFWDLAQMTSPSIAYRLSHFCKHGLPDDSDIAAAFAEVYLETLIADDDDGNLKNGTPNGVAIENAFCNHGIGSNLFSVERLSHSPYPNTLDTYNDYQVEIELLPSFFTGLAFQDLELVFTTDNFLSVLVVPFQLGAGQKAIANIPAQPEGSLVKYFIRNSGPGCGFQLFYPSRDFKGENHSFRVGEFYEVYRDEFEIDAGWQVGAPGDNATSGIWVRGNPQRTADGKNQVVQPEDDFSPAGVSCLVTGAFQGTTWFSNDVDGGRTSVTSPIISGLEENSIIEFEKWFAHGAGFNFPNLGQWRFEASNNGLAWIPIEVVSYGDHRNWINTKYRLGDHLVVSDSMQFRFVAADYGTGSIVEALVDDIVIWNPGQVSSLYPSSMVQDEVQFFPNPSESNFRVKKSLVKEIIGIRNSKGGYIYFSAGPSEDFIIINLRNQASGIYFITFIDQNGIVKTQKLNRH